MTVRRVTRREYLILQASIETNAPWPVVLEAVSTTALEHPEWDMDELVDAMTGEAEAQ